MIGDTTGMILRLLEDARVGTPFAGPDFNVSADDSQSLRAGITVRLLRVELAAALRTARAVREPATSRVPDLDLHYVLTPWAPDPITQHRLLDWLLLTIHGSPIAEASSGSIRLIPLSLSAESEIRAWKALYPGRPLLPSIHVQAKLNPIV